jgi:hypothetical protein
MNSSNYARALRCIGQALQNLEIEAFELKTYAGDFRLTAGDPHPPYTALIELTSSPQGIEVLDREGQARRGRSAPEVKFDSLAEMLRAIGEYMDSKHVHLRRLENSDSFGSDIPTLTIEYSTRNGELQKEDLPMTFIRDASVRMYKHRARVSNTIDLLTRKR